jgi:REP element-mobilizing transposase RayT
MPGHSIRKRDRLPGFDYGSPGAYFVTVCTHQRACLFGGIVDGVMRLNATGSLAQTSWLDIPRHFPDVEMDVLVVMPNHLHGILTLHGRGTACRAPTEAFGQPIARSVPTEAFGRPLAGSIPTIIRSFKAASARQINLQRGTPGATLWQRGYYEHIIRTPSGLDRLRRHIESNPVRWELDRENAMNT